MGAASNLGLWPQTSVSAGRIQVRNLHTTDWKQLRGSIPRRRLATNFALPLHGLKKGVESCVPSWRDAGAPHAGRTGTGNDTATTTASPSNPPSVARLVGDDHAPFDANWLKFGKPATRPRTGAA